MHILHINNVFSQKSNQELSMLSCSQSPIGLLCSRYILYIVQVHTIDLILYIVCICTRVYILWYAYTYSIYCIYSVYVLHMYNIYTLVCYLVHKHVM